jgi:hypothetical protein
MKNIYVVARESLALNRKDKFYSICAVSTVCEASTSLDCYGRDLLKGMHLDTNMVLRITVYEYPLLGCTLAVVGTRVKS